MPPRITTTAKTTAAAARGSHPGMRSARTLSAARAAIDGPVLTFGIGVGIAMGRGMGGGRGAAAMAVGGGTAAAGIGLGGGGMVGWAGRLSGSGL